MARRTERLAAGTGQLPDAGGGGVLRKAAVSAGRLLLAGARKAGGFEPGKVRKILLLKVCCVGDILFTSPSVRALRKAFPSAEIVYLAGRWSLAAARGNPHINRVIEFPEGGGPVSLVRVAARLRGERFDLAVNFHRSVSSGLFLLAAGVRWRAGFDWRGGGFTLTHPAPFDSGVHEVRRYFAILRALGVEPDGEATELAVSPAGRAAGRGVLGEAGLDPAGKIALLFPGGGKNPGTVLLAKRWSPEGYGKLASWLKGRGFGVGIVGAPDESDLASRVVELSNGAAVSLAGKTTMETLPGVIANASYFVGGDSGPSHMAAAVGVPTLFLFGPSDPRLVAPLNGCHTVVWLESQCSPCYEPETVFSRKFLECREWVCMKGMGPELVLKQAGSHLDRLGL